MKLARLPLRQLRSAKECSSKPTRRIWRPSAYSKITVKFQGAESILLAFLMHMLEMLEDTAGCEYVLGNAETSSS